jgi:hypothetical protein
VKLLTKEIARKLPGLNESVAGKQMAVVKFFTPWTDWTWYGIEYDPKTQTFWGVVDGFEKEYGYFNLGELERVTGPHGLQIERDMYFTPTPIAELM